MIYYNVTTKMHKTKQKKQGYKNTSKQINKGFTWTKIITDNEKLIKRCFIPLLNF